MSWGLRSRLARIIRGDGRAVMLAVDHGYFMGPTRRLEDPRKTITPLLPHTDSLMVTRGVLRNCVDPKADVPVVLRVSGGTSILNEDLSKEKITTSVKDALRLNASAVAMSIFVGAPHEHDTLVSLGELVNECEDIGLPVLAVTAVGKELEKRDARFLGLATRLAAEFGAHVVKTYYCDGFRKVVDGCPVPLVIAGGPRLNTEMDAFQMTYDAVHDGAVGVDMGRNIWQNDHPVAMIQAVRAIVHGDASVKEAADVYRQAREGKKGKR